MEAATYEDCHTLVENFVAAGSFQFKSFCSQWKNLMFQHMYSCQTSVVEVVLTTSAIFHMAKRTICAKDEFGKYLATAEGNEKRNLLRRLGGLYLLYGVYFKQPTRRFVKVQVSMETWRDMMSFIDSLDLDPQMDCARYTFWRLYQADAFRFTALDYMVGLEGLVDYDKIGDGGENEHSEIVRVKLKHKLNSVTEIKDNLDDLTKLEDAYNNIKQEINGPAHTNHKVRALPTTHIFHKLQDVINSIHNIIDDLPVQAEKKTDSTIATTRMNIKRKAAGYTDCNEDESSDESEDLDSNCDNSQQKPKKRAIKKGQAARFSKPSGIFNQNLPDHITHDLVDGSSTYDDDNAEEQELNESCNKVQKDKPEKTYTNL